MKRILVINPFGIGDVIFSMPLVEALRKAFPDATIGFLCNERTADLVRLNTSIDQTFIFQRDLFRRLWKKNPFLFFKDLGALLALVKAYQFDTAFDLSLGREYSFFCWRIGIKKRIGFDYRGRGIFLTDKIRLEGYENRRVAEIQMDLLDRARVPYEKEIVALPIRASLSVIKEADHFLRQKGVQSGDRLIALAPGGGKSWGKDALYKQWDPERFAKSVDLYSSDQKVKVLLLGDHSEQGLLERTAALLKTPSFVVAGEPIEKVCVLLQRSNFLCCNDGGLLHLAAALGVKTVSVFGPVDEKVYGPYGDHAAHEVLTEPVACRPCYKKFHFPPCPYDRRCLKDLAVEKVVAAMRKIA